MTLKRCTVLALAAALPIALHACSNESPDVGSAEVALTNAPADVHCVRLTISGARKVVRLFDVTPGANAVYQLNQLPVGLDQFSAEAFDAACPGVADTDPASWSSEVVAANVAVLDLVHVALKMIHNGRASVGIDFDDRNGPTPSPPPPGQNCVRTTQPPYLVPTAPGIRIQAILTAGEVVNGYAMVGIPDGLGAYSNSGGTFSLLANHEVTAADGAVRAHGTKGAFVSRWTIRRSDLAVCSGEDLIKSVQVFDVATLAYRPALPAPPDLPFARFCSADLAPRSAFFDPASGLGYDGRIFLNGEENGPPGRAMAHLLDGTSYELPRLGKQSWENSLANPATGRYTVVAEDDDSTPGQVFVYVGKKTGSGTPVERAGLTNGTLFGIAVDGFTAEPATGIPSGTPFHGFALGNVETWSGTRLDTESDTNGVTRFNRPEDGAWDPNNPSHYYFVTTNGFTAPSRLWRLRFDDPTNPAAGGSIDMLLDGTEGQKMMDNITIDKLGHVYALEDVGNNDHVGKVWRYDIATDSLTMVAQHNPALFDPAVAAPLLTRDEEASGIIDASDVLGKGWFLIDVQAHFKHPDPAIFEGGQFLAIFDEAAAN